MSAVSDTTEYWWAVKDHYNRLRSGPFPSPEQIAKTENRRLARHRRKKELHATPCVCGHAYKSHGRAQARKHLKTNIACKHCKCERYQRGQKMQQWERDMRCCGVCKNYYHYWDPQHKPSCLHFRTDQAYTRVSIIGTAGRREDGYKLNYFTYVKMYKNLTKHLAQIEEQEDNYIMAISGGAAWADHLAVTAYLADRVRALTLYLPAPFDMDNVCFKDEGDFKNSRGRSSGSIANYYHGLMTAKMPEKRSTLAGIRKAIEKGAHVVVGQGFRNRNKMVARCSYMIAYTFGESTTRPKDGGTSHTWANAPTGAQQIHVPIASLEM